MFPKGEQVFDFGGCDGSLVRVWHSASGGAEDANRANRDDNIAVAGRFAAVDDLLDEAGMKG